MADPTKYKPHFNYSGWEAAGSKRPKPGAELDTDFADIARSIDETIDALKDIRRSDGKLNNGIVDKDALEPGLGTELEGYADRAEKAVEDAEGLYGNLEAVEQAKDEAVQARDEAQALYGDLEAVEQAKTEAQSARSAAETARDDAQSAASSADRDAGRAESARDAAQLNARVYPITAAGLAATTDGDYFSVPSDDSDEYLILYRNNEGSATEVRRYPSAEGVERRLSGIEQVDEPDLQMPVFDRDGVVLSGYAEDGAWHVDRMRFNEVEITENQRISAIDHPLFRWALYGMDGDIHAGLRKDGMFAAGGLQVGFSGEVVSAEHPEFGFFIAAADGVIVAGVTKEGKWLPEGSGGGGDDPPEHEVSTIWVEPWLDPSENLYVSWLTDSADAVEMEFRQAGTSVWYKAESVRSRPFPTLAHLHVHTAVLVGLSPATVYECRFPGSSFTDKFRTCPKSGVKAAIISDHQDTDYSETAHMRTLAADARERGADLMGFIGDLANDNGQFTVAKAQDWLSMLDAISTEYRKEGAVIPAFWVMGNHDGAKADGSPNAALGGDGIIGHVGHLMSWSYFEEHPTRHLNSAATFSVGSELFVITIETDHTEHLEDQWDWLIDQVAEAHGQYDHIVIAGHVPAFMPDAATEANYKPTGRKLRNNMYPGLEPYADKIACYVCGHTHALAITPPLRVDYDPEMSDEDNDGRYVEDPLAGIVQLGTGPVQFVPFNVDRVGETSALDGSPMFVAGMGRNTNGNVNSPPDVRGTGITNAPATGAIQHYWLFEFDSGFKATAYGLAGLPYYVHEKE